MRRKIVLGVLTGLVGALALGLWVSRNLERVTEVRWKGYSGQARINPYFALETLSEEREVFAAIRQSGSRRIEPHGLGEALVLVDPERRLDPGSTSALLAWVASGSLLVVAPSRFPEDDLLFRALGVEVLPPGEAEAPSEEVGEVPEEARGARGPRLSTTVTLPSGLALEPVLTRIRRSPEEPGRVLLGFEHGEGWVWVVSDPGLWRNSRLKTADHAHLFFALLAGPEPVTSFTLSHRSDAPSLAALLGRHAWPALLSGGVLVLALLSAVGRRFGPPLPGQSPPRRRLLEHIEATGAYLRSKGHSDLLAAASRHALLRRAKDTGAPLSKAGRQQQVARLASLTGTDPAEVEAALQGPASSNPADLFSTLKTLERLRRSL